MTWRRALLFLCVACCFGADFPSGVAKVPFDPTLGVIRLDRLSGAPLAVLVNYACHPVVFGPDNPNYSADYPSEMRNVFEEGLGGKAIRADG